MVWDQWEKRRDAVTDPDTLCSDELQPVDTSSHKLSKLERSVGILHQLTLQDSMAHVFIVACWFIFQLRIEARVATDNIKVFSVKIL